MLPAATLQEHRDRFTDVFGPGRGLDGPAGAIVVRPGEFVEITVAYSEVRVHMRVHGQRMTVQLLEGRHPMVQLYRDGQSSRPRSPPAKPASSTTSAAASTTPGVERPPAGPNTKASGNANFPISDRSFYSWVMGRASGQRISAVATRRTLLKGAANLPPDRSVTVHVFADGWSVRRLAFVSDLLREGTLMSNCLAWDDYPRALRTARKGADAPLRPEGSLHRRYFSLRDGDNLPHATFTAANFSGRARGHARTINQVLGRHNDPPKAEYLRRIYARWRHCPADGIMCYQAIGRVG